MEPEWHIQPVRNVQKDSAILLTENALHISKNYFDKIKSRLEERKKAQESIERAKARKEHYKQESKDMVDKWENSIQVVMEELSNEFNKNPIAFRIYGFVNNLNAGKRK